MTGWNVRADHDHVRAVQASGNGDEVARGSEPERQREQHAEHGREDRDLQAFEHAGIEKLELVGREIRRKHPRDEAVAVFQADQEARPGDVEDLARIDDISASTMSAPIRAGQFGGNATRRAAAGDVTLIRAILRRRRSRADAESCSCFGGPSNTISPFDMPMMRSAKRRPSSTLWMLTISRDVALAGALGDQLHDLDRGLRIERRGRLVGEDQIRLLHQRARDADALALAAGQLVGALGGEVAEADRDRAGGRRDRCRRAGTSAATRARPPHSRAGRTARSRSPRAARPDCIPGTPCRCGGAPCATPCRAISRDPGRERGSRPRSDRPDG